MKQLVWCSLIKHDILKTATHFLAFPHGDEMKISTAGTLEKIGDLWKLSYGQTKEEDGISFNINHICMLTEIPKEDPDGNSLKKGNIYLRDKNGDFDGRVDITVDQRLD